MCKVWIIFSVRSGFGASLAESRCCCVDEFVVWVHPRVELNPRVELRTLIDFCSGCKQRIINSMSRVKSLKAAEDNPVPVCCCCGAAETLNVVNDVIKTSPGKHEHQELRVSLIKQRIRHEFNLHWAGHGSMLKIINSRGGVPIMWHHVKMLKANRETTL